MKILFLHTYYLQKGGEDAVFEQDYKLLEKTGLASSLSFRNLSGWKGGLQFLLSIWNVFAARKLMRAIRKEQPDIIHMHNLHFAIGPIAIRVAKKAGIPVVLTLHNFRLLYPSGILFRDDNLVSEVMSGKFPWKAVRNKVYRNSLLQTFWLAFVVWFHKKIGTWNMTDRYIVQTGFSRDIFVRSSLGIPGEKFLVNPNFVHPPQRKSIPKRDHFLFIGRLSSEKGIEILLDSFSNSEYELQIAGDGPLTQRVSEHCNKNERIKYLGKLDRQGVYNAMEECSALIFPSIWFEGMPMTILEAFSLGVPVIASDDGAMSVLIRHGYNGLLFDMGNAEDLKIQLGYWNRLDAGERQRFSVNALNEFEQKYSPTEYKTNIINIYNQLMDAN